MTKIFRY